MKQFFQGIGTLAAIVTLVGGIYWVDEKRDE